MDEPASDARAHPHGTGGTLRASYPLTERLRHALYTTIREDEINGVSDDASIDRQAGFPRQSRVRANPGRNHRHLATERRAVIESQSGDVAVAENRGRVFV